MRIVPYSEWAAGITPNATPAAMPAARQRLWLHHGATGTSTIATARSYARFHIGPQRRWAMIGYSFLIAAGQVLEGRGVGRQGAHTKGDNDQYAVCLAGNYQHQPPSDEDQEALVWLVRHGREQGWWPAGITDGHRNAPGASTSCPGSAALRLIPTINRRALQEDDMTPAQARMLEEIHDVLGIQTVDGRGRMQATEGWNLSNWLVKAMPALVAARVDPAQVDSGAVADAIREGLGDEVAGRVADEIKRRL